MCGKHYRRHENLRCGKFVKNKGLETIIIYRVMLRMITMKKK